MTKSDELVGRATESGCLRTVMVLPLWLVRLLVQGFDDAPPRIATLILDFLLIAAHFWAVRPLFRALPGQYPDRTHARGHLWTPVVLAGFILLRDLYFWLSGRPL